MSTVTPPRVRQLNVTTPFGKELIIRGLEGEEQVSGLFKFIVKMVSPKASLDFTKIVGKPITIEIALGDHQHRYINGVVTRFIEAGSVVKSKEEKLYSYVAEVRPWLWLLTLGTDSRIFQNKSVPEILESVFSAFTIKDHKKKLTRTYAKREYCVQYQETHFAFVSRLMEDEGIHYYFEHKDGVHTLILADDASAHVNCPGRAKARLALTWQRSDKVNLITQLRYEEYVVTTGYAMADYDFEVPQKPVSVKAGKKHELQVYEYPGGFTKREPGQSRAERRVAIPTTKRIEGHSACRGFVPGYKFTLQDHERSSLNTAYLLMRVSHKLSADDLRYTNEFSAIPADAQFRPLRQTARPIIPGTQTAVVVGKIGEEIWTDKYGRIKVQFHWDRLGKKNENSSCWIRVAQPWAGKHWGAWTLPRMGHEVVVSFLEGAPDRPLVTGSVYNADQVVPYPLPAHQTRSTMKTRSSKMDTGYNEMRYEDKKGMEEIYIHAQKDMNIDVLNSRTTTIGTPIKGGDDTLTVTQGKRIIHVDTGDEHHDVKMGQRTVKVKGNEDHTNLANFTHLVVGNYKLTIAGSLTIEAAGNISIRSGMGVSVQAALSISNMAGVDMTSRAGKSLSNEAGMTLSNKAGLSLSNEGGVSVVSKAGGSQIVDGGGALTLKGGIVKIG